MNRTTSHSQQIRAVTIPIQSQFLHGDLVLPVRARGVVLFAHGSGSSRNSPRNRFVAQALQEERLATLLVDLLTPEEERIDNVTSHLRFDIGLLADRLLKATEWLQENHQTAHLKIGYFGASTGGGAALVAAAERPRAVGAVVSRGGRPDLAGPSLPRVQAPTLLLVGERDIPVIRMNRDAMQHMTSPVQLEIIPHATHLFEEPGTLELVAQHAAQFFVRHLSSEGS